MKNLFAIPRLSLFAAFTILITLVVCLAGFTGAEVVYSNYQGETENRQRDEDYPRKQSSLKGNTPYLQEPLKTRGEELLKETNFASYLKNYGREEALDNLMKRHSDDFGESDDIDGEKENDDGYGYDDDEYYHFDFKRNEDSKESIGKNKEEPLEMLRKDGIKNQKFLPSKIPKENSPKETETIELLNFKETHPLVGEEQVQSSMAPQIVISKAFGNEDLHKKSSDPPENLKMGDIKENLAINEKVKENRKDESGKVVASGAVDQKPAEVKKENKVVEDKNKVKLKESKAEVDPEKTEKQVNVKEGKDSVANKNIKEPAKAAEEKENHVAKVEKLNENAKIEKSEDKFSSKNKEGDPVKFSNEGKAGMTLLGKVGSESANPNAVSQINSRASFVSSDYKDDPNALKTPGVKEDKKLEEANENDKNSGLTDYRDDIAERKDSLRDEEGRRNYEYMNNGEDASYSLGRGLGKMKDHLSYPVSFEAQNDGSGDFYKKRESWREHAKIQHEPQQQPPSDTSGKNQYRLNFPASELENTDYHKNYIKSLRRYKGMEDSPKVLNVDPTSYNKSGIREPVKRKRSQVRKRKSMMYEESLCGLPENYRNPSDHWSIRRSAQQSRNMLGNELQSYYAQHPSLQSMNNLKILNEDADVTLREDRKYENRNVNYRWRRGSPQKLEYEIKIIDQNHQDGKNPTLSNSGSKRRKKDVRTKLAEHNDNKNLKKYPYSQVSVDDLTKLNQKKFIETQKIKRRISPWEQREPFGGGPLNTKSHVRVRGVPTGYYSNRVKFGQKRLSENDPGQPAEGKAFDAGAAQPSPGIDRSPLSYDQSRMQTPSESNAAQPAVKNRFSIPYDNSPTNSDNNKNLVQWGWEVKNPEYKHDPIKRFDSNSFLNREYGVSPLLLVKKGWNGERITKAFLDGTGKASSEENLDPNQIAKILAQDHDYVLLRRADQNKFQRISGNGELSNQINFENPFSGKKANTFESMKDNSKQIENRGLNVRSDHWGEDKKFSAKFYNSEGKSGFRKTFEKLKDFADFFKDSEQELSDNQRQLQEKKEGSDIVFSEDKLPDPIVITNEINQKLANFKAKPQNAMSAMTTNFKALEQGKSDLGEIGKNIFGTDSKPDFSQSNWEPALKNAFPEAKSVNSVQRNGNEIIVLDFNRNKLKPEHGNRGNTQCDSRSKGVKQSVLGPVGSIPGSPFLLPGDRQVEVIINDGSIPMVLQQSANKFLSTDKKNSFDKSNGEVATGEGVSIVGSPDQRVPMTIPLNQLSQLPNILKTLSEKKSNNFKVLTKKSSKPENEMSPNLNQFLKDFRDLTENSKGNNYNKNGKSMRKRNLREENLPSATFSEPSDSGDPNVKYLGSLLHNFVPNENAGSQDNREMPYETGSALYKNTDGYPRSDRWYADDANPDLRRQSQWTSADEGRQDYAPVVLDNSELISGKVQKDAKEPLQSSESRGGEESDYQDELWQELSAASDKIQRLRREGMSKRKLRKTIEDALSFRQRRQSDKSNSFPGSIITDSNKKLASDSKPADSESKTSPEKLEDGVSSVAVDLRNQKGSDLQSEARIKGDSKESPEPEKAFLKSDFKSHLSESPESKNEKEGLIGSNENGVSRRTRRHVHRRKRSPSHDIKNKVSRTEVENTILENLAEDNYQSVYSPGIKRKLLSTEDEPEDADSYYGTDGSEKGKAAGESRPQCLKNKLNKCIDPLIIELFGGEEAENEKSRDRRSLTTGFHSNYKREIDLDESMPNDFQNFLVTSLGGFGSQKREVVKKEEALWEGKETSQDNYNQIADNSVVGKDINEDSALEKREAPNNGNLKRGSFKGRDYYDNRFESSSLSEAHAVKKTRSQDKSLEKMNAPECEQEKTPTQIRIKITNEGGKEKKASKPIMEERDSSPTEVETPSKEKEFFDKNKLSSMRVSSSQKLHQFPKSKYSYAVEMRRGQRDENADRQKLYVSARPYRRGRRNKKKFVQENPMKPMKDFSALDQNTVESLIQRYLADQSWYGSTTQKMPVSNHLPQVETVYNPSQGTNKAQLEGYRSSKTNLPIHKSFEKNSLKDNDASAYDEGPLRSYIKDKGTKAKEEKPIKDFEDVDWTPFSGNSRTRQEGSRIGSITARNFKNYDTDNESGGDLTGGTNSAPLHLNPYYQRQYFKSPTSGYFYHAPTSAAANSVYDTIRMRKDYPNRPPPAKEHGGSKLRGKSTYLSTSSHNRQDEKERSPIRYAYDFYPNKKPFSQKYKSRDYFGTGLKSSENRNRPEFTASEHEFVKNIDEEKPSLYYPTQFYNVDSSKEPDYFETVEEEYLDDESSKQEPQVDDSLTSNPSKKGSKAWETGYHEPYDLKSSDADDTAAEEEYEFDDDYEESNEEDDLDDYALLSADSSKTKSQHGSEKLQNSIPVDDALHSYSNSFPSTADKLDLREYEFRPAELKDGKTDEHLESGSQKITLTDNKGDVDTLGGTQGVLKKVNENTNIFGQNLMKSLNKFNYDETSDKLQKDKNLGDVSCQELNQRKMDFGLKPKRSEEFSRMGNPIFYTGKVRMRNAEPREYFPQEEEIRGYGNKENVYYRLSKRNPLNAELRGAENEFENESEENERHFINSKEDEGEEAEGRVRKNEEDGGTNKRDSEDSEKGSDTKDNFDDNEETSEDNVLENVIGKYIMRKSMKIAPEPKFKGPNMASEEMRKDFDSVSEDSKKHKSSKRSVENEVCDGHERIGKWKRLSSGHLTEANFRKYHKKNFNRKRLANVQLDTDTGNPNGNTNGDGSKLANDIELEKADENEKAVDIKEGRETKRSALGLFQKFTSKEKENKKLEGDEPLSLGFEPLYTDKKFQEIGRNQDSALVMEKKPQNLNENPQAVFFRSPDLSSEGCLTERRKEITSEPLKERSAVDADGPWRVELNKNNPGELPDKILLENKYNFQKTQPEPAKKNEPGAVGELRAYLVISKNVRTARRSPNSAEGHLPISGAAEREVGNSYRRKSDESAGNPDKRKRSLETSGHRLTSDREDGLRTQVPITENRISIEEKNRALHDTRGLSEGDSKDEQPPRAQRNTEKSSSVSAEADKENPGEKFPSKRRLFNRKSVFSPRSEANIIGDGGHLNEETSEYLGQQIVGAILAHVSSDPRLRESIAPGLAIRTPACREGLHDSGGALPPSEFSDNVQSLLPNPMFGTRKIRKKRTRRRSCNKINKQSKEFLDFLVKGSKENESVPHNVKNNICSAIICNPQRPLKNADSSNSNIAIPVPQKSKNTQGNTENIPNSAHDYSQEGLANLKRRQVILLKLIEDYHHLSILEKQNLELHYQYILQELDKTNRALDSPCEGAECGQNQAFQNRTSCEFIKKSKGFAFGPKFDNLKESMDNKTSYARPSNSLNYPSSNSQGPETPCEGFEKTVTQDIEGLKNSARDNGTSKSRMPSYSFEPVDQKPNSGFATPRPSSSDKSNSENRMDYRFPSQKKNEDIFSRSRQQGPFHKPPPNNGPFNESYNYKNMSSEPPSENRPNPDERPAIAPETFDLLFWNSDPESLAPAGSESVRVKQSLPKNPRYRITEMGNPFRYGLEHFPTQFLSGFKPSELNKLGSGDAASLQLSVKNHGQWKSNLEINKIKTPGGVEEPAPPVEARSSKERLRELSPDDTSSNLLFKGKGYPNKAIFPLRLDKKLYTKKVLPFRTLKNENEPNIPMEFALKKLSNLWGVDRKNVFPNAGRREKRMCEIKGKTKTKLVDGDPSLEHATGSSRLAGRRDHSELGSQPDDVPFQNQDKFSTKEMEQIDSV